MTTTIDISEMNKTMRSKCEEAARLFPDIDPKVIGKIVKAAVMAAEVAVGMNRKLNQEGKELSPVGLARAFAESLKHVAGE